MDKVQLINFFKEQGIYDGKNVSGLKNLYTVISMINEQQCFDAYIKGKIYEVRNPYKSVYPIKVFKDFIKNISKRINGTIKIERTNLTSRKYFCDAVLFAAIIFHKMGYVFSEEELARIKECYDISEELTNNKLLGFKSNVSYDDIQMLLAGESYSEEECSKYRKSLEDAIKILNDSDKTLKYIHYCVQNNKDIRQNKAICDIVSLVCNGYVNFNERANISCSKIDYVAKIMNQGITSYAQLQEEEEFDKSYGDIAFDEKRDLNMIQ